MPMKEGADQLGTWSNAESNHESSRGPASKRKKVVAPLGKEEKMDKKFVYISPMPLGIAVVGARLLKNKGILPK